MSFDVVSAYTLLVGDGDGPPTVSVHNTADEAWRALDFIKLPTNPYLWMDHSAPATERRFYRAITMAPTNMVFIPAGTYRLNSQLQISKGITVRGSGYRFDP